LEHSVEDKKAVIVWFRDDFRLQDNPALDAAIKTGQPIIPVFILELKTRWSYGEASKLWLGETIRALSTQLHSLGSYLVCFQGDPNVHLPSLIEKTGANSIYWNRRYDPLGVALDKKLFSNLNGDCAIKSFEGRLLSEPTRLKSGGGTPYKVFTPFYNMCLKMGFDITLSRKPDFITSPSSLAFGQDLDVILPRPQLLWQQTLVKQWAIGEEAALKKLDFFIGNTLRRYSEGRDFPSLGHISFLSPHLRFGEISVRRIWHEIQRAATLDPQFSTNSEIWGRQLLWRDFAYNILFHFPSTAEKPLRGEDNALLWVDNEEAFTLWTKGETGFPIIDAGMRELWATGFMHNRVRMLVASFLCKHLGIHWLKGAEWFWNTLVDADLASNSFGWQWSAGCGADAAPYFRIFNPLTQSKKFDPDGVYIKQWIPELQRLKSENVHEPGVVGYAIPLVELSVARSAALARLAKSKC
jgi:deoxyribodipyrimidine photo-lyase